METIGFFLGGLGDIFSDPVILVYIAVGVFLGSIVGLIPGLGPSTSIALLLPLAMALDPGAALVMMTALYLGAEYGGRISSILLNMPGEAGAMMTTLDGYPLAVSGQASRALKLSAIGSFVGSIISIAGLVLLAAPLASLALNFGPSAYAAVVVMALVLASTLVGSGFVKSLVAVGIGLLIATIGIDSQAGTPRFTFGVSGLLDGVDIIVVIIGLFGVGEILSEVAQRRSGESKPLDAKGGRVSREDLRTVTPTMVRGSLLGFIAGVLPGAGATLGSFMGYSIEKKVARDKSKFGKGDIRGLVAPEAANNASVAGAMVPTLSLGIPGSGTTAVLLAYLMMYGLNPGPSFFVAQADLAWLIIASLAVSAVLGLLLNYSMAGFFASILRIPAHYLYSFIILLAIISAYGLHGSLFDVSMVIVFGAIGYFFRLMGISSPLVVIGLILGEILERTLRQAYLLANGNFVQMLADPFTLLFLGIAVAAIIFEFSAGRKVAKQMREAADIQE